MRSKVYFSREITPEKVVALYHALQIDLPGKVAVKVHSGEKVRMAVPGGGSGPFRPHAFLSFSDRALWRPVSGRQCSFCVYWKTYFSRGVSARLPCPKSAP